MHDIHSFKPYQRYLTIRLFLTFILVGIIGSTAVFFFRSRVLFQETQATLKQVAQNAVDMLPVAEHERIQRLGDEQSADYTEIIERFSAMISGNPSIDDIYTLRPTAREGFFTFVVSAQPTGDSNGDGVVDQAEIRPAVGEEYDATALPRLREGLIGPAADDAVTIDKWGAWVSGYAPVKDASGKTVAVLGVDYSASVIEGQRMDLIRSLLVVDFALLLPLLLIAWLVSRALAKPYQTLARAMYDVAHGDVHKQLPLHGSKSSRVFAELFNGMVQIIGSAKHSKDDSR